MKIADVIADLELTVVAGDAASDADVCCGYVGDLLSDVLGHAQIGDLWVTMQVHRNIVAVATVKELSGIILVSGHMPGAETIAAAEQEGVPLLVSPLPAFELVGRLYSMGISGMGSRGENL